MQVENLSGGAFVGVCSKGLLTSGGILTELIENVVCFLSCKKGLVELCGEVIMNFDRIEHLGSTTKKTVLFSSGVLCQHVFGMRVEVNSEVGSI